METEGDIYTDGMYTRSGLTVRGTHKGEVHIKRP